MKHIIDFYNKDIWKKLPNDLIMLILNERRLIKEKERLIIQKKHQLNMRSVLWEIPKVSTFYGFIYNTEERCNEYWNDIKIGEVLPFKIRNL